MKNLNAFRRHTKRPGKSDNEHPPDIIVEVYNIVGRGRGYEAAPDLPSDINSQPARGIQSSKFIIRLVAGPCPGPALIRGWVIEATLRFSKQRQYQKRPIRAGVP